MTLYVNKLWYEQTIHQSPTRNHSLPSTGNLNAMQDQLRIINQ